MKITGLIEEAKLCHSISSKEWLLRPGWHKIKMEACVDVDVEAGLKLPLEVVEEEDHQFHLLLGMIEWTTCLKLHVEHIIDKDVLIVML